MAVVMTRDPVQLVVRGDMVLVRRGRKSILLLDAAEARDLGADMVLVAKSLLSTVSERRKGPV